MATILETRIGEITAKKSAAAQLFSRMEIEELAFNLREIDLDLTRLAEAMSAFAENGDGKAFLAAVESFKYGALEHIEGHLDTIEQMTERALGD